MHGPLDTTRETITFAHLVRFAVRTSRAQPHSHAAFKHGFTRWATRKWEWTWSVEWTLICKGFHATFRFIVV